MSSSYIYSHNILPSIIAALFVFALALYSFRNRQVPGALPFSIACMLGFLWSVGSIFEFAAIDIDLKIFWRKFQVIMQMPSATAITCFLLEYARPGRWLTRRNLLLLSIVPVLISLVIVTNDLHQLFWEDFVLNGVLIAVPGPLMKYFIAYVYANFLLNLSIFVWIFIKSPQNRLPVVFMVFGQIMMRVLYFVDIADQNLLNFPLAVIGIAISSSMYSIAFFRYQILGPIPLARQAMIEQLPIGMIVLDDQGKIHSLNPAAEIMLKITNKAAKGLQIVDVLPVDIRNSYAEVTEESIEFECDIEGGKRCLLLNGSSLQDWRKLEIGRLLLLTDISDRRKAQNKIIEQQRVLATLKERELLARELHDDLGQTLSFIHTQSQTINRLLGRGDMATVREYLLRLVEVSARGEADIRESILGMRLSSSEGGLIKTLEGYLKQYQQNHQINTELLIPEAFTEKRLDAMVEIQVLRIIQEALTNISKHAGAENVRIGINFIDSALCITVKDDGVGFNFVEDQSSLADHFGLQMMRERAEAIEGQIKLISQPGQGTEIRVCVPVSEGW